jgi:hypothetical protein
MKPNICYALKLFTYDYYEWEEIFAVSFDPELLRLAYRENADQEVDANVIRSLSQVYKNAPLLDSRANGHEALGEAETPHWIIEPIKFL